MSDWQQTRALLGEPWPGGYSLGDDLRVDYAKFLQADVSPWERRDEGLQGVFRAIFPIKDFNDSAQLEFVSYELQPPTTTPDECRRKGETYASPLRVTLRLIIWDTAESGDKIIRDIKEQEVYFGELPALTPEGTFVIGGVDRVIVRQLAASPGVRFLRPEGARIKAQITPKRGSRLAFEIDQKGIAWASIDGRRKMHATVLLRALGYTTEALLNEYYPIETYTIDAKGKVWLKLEPELLIGQRAWVDIKVGDEVLIKKNRKITRLLARKLIEQKVEQLPVDPEYLLGRTSLEDLVDQQSGEIILETSEILSGDWFERLRHAGISRFKLIVADGFRASTTILDTMRADKIYSSEEAILEVYRRLRPGDPPTVETAQWLFNNLFFNPERTDLSKAGRWSLNRKLHPHDAPPDDTMVLTRVDLIEAVRQLVQRALRGDPADDPDDVSEAVVRDVGELVSSPVQLGLVRTERAAKERMSMSMELEALMPHDLVNARPVQKLLDEFFAFSRVSERVNFTSPAAELMQRRRLSTAEPNHQSMQRGSGYAMGGLHGSHLGYFCPIERGLVAAPALSCMVDDGGLLLTTCQPFEQAVRPDGTPPVPWEMLGLGAALIPFVNHDAPETASRGVDNLRSALPPLRPEPPRVASGLEAETAHSAGLTVKARAAGRVARVTAREVVIEGPEGEVPHPLRTFEHAPRGAYVHQRPVVRAGQRVQPGDVLAVGPGVASGELAVGHNLVVALLSGPTFGGSVVVSERVVAEGRFATLHLREHRALVASVGPDQEAFTADVPGLDDEERAQLDEQGVIRVGSRVRGGDVLAGRVRTTQQHLAADEDERTPPLDISLRLPPGQEGVVIEARIDSRRQAKLPRRATARARVVVAAVRPLEVGDLLGSRHGDRGTVAAIALEQDMPILPDGRAVDVLLDPSVLLESNAAGVWMELLAGGLGVPLLAPPFASVTEDKLRAMRGGDGRVTLRDGRTGEPLDMPATVGALYLMKLPPLAADVIEARSTGPYDARTEEPVAGPLSPNGQLLGEEEIMALLAHGAAHTLREILTGKSDDPVGREELAQALRTGDEIHGHVPQGIDALFRELRAAALYVEAGDEPPQAAPVAAAPPAIVPPTSAAAPDAAEAPARRKRRGSKGR